MENLQKSTQHRCDEPAHDASNVRADEFPPLRRVRRRDAGCKILFLITIAALLAPTITASFSSSGPRSGFSGRRSAHLSLASHIPVFSQTTSRECSPSGSPSGSSTDVRQGRTQGERAQFQFQAAGEAPNALHRRDGMSLRRTISFRSGLVHASGAPYGEAALPEQQMSLPREDFEYRAKGDPNSQVFTLLQTGIYPQFPDS